MRWVCDPSVFVEGDGNLGDTGFGQAGLDDHFCGELHSRALLVEGVVKFAGKTSHAAINIMDGSVKPCAHHEGEHRIADPAMGPRHGAWGDFSAAGGEAAALDKIETLSDFAGEFWNFTEVVAVVGIAHENVLATGGGDATHESGSVTFGRNGDDSSSKFFCDLLGAICAAVISDDDFSRHPRFL